ncbi:DgyrCDS13077 [Dimorphilus gyrociliatus]|nr:DgyrCDS13077 [Dimorphilus gyrociliatus]
MFKAESPIIKERIDPFLESLNDMITNTDYVSSGEKIDFESIFSGLATGLIVFGLLLIVLTLAVMIGSCCLNIFLIIYAIFVFALILVQAILLGMFFTEKFDDKMKTNIEETIRDKYRGTDKFDIDSVLINLIHLKWECCGVNGFRDFDTAKVWERNRTKEITVGSQTIKQSVVLATPISCCKMKGSFPSADPVEPKTCALIPGTIPGVNTPIDQISNRDVKCWDKIKDEIESKKGLIVGVGCGLIGFQLLLAILAIIAYITTRNEKNSKVNYA